MIYVKPEMEIIELTEDNAILTSFIDIGIDEFECMGDCDIYEIHELPPDGIPE